MKTTLLIVLAFAAGAAAMFFWKQRTPPRKEFPELRLQLNQAAERNLPLPTLEATPLPTP
ncbi:MAG: hypothetical protein ABIT76_11385 [Chthoniobacterales bacterium]